MKVPFPGVLQLWVQLEIQRVVDIHKDTVETVAKHRESVKSSADDVDDYMVKNMPKLVWLGCQ